MLVMDAIPRTKQMGKAQTMMGMAAVQSPPNKSNLVVSWPTRASFRFLSCFLGATGWAKLRLTAAIGQSSASEKMPMWR